MERVANNVFRADEDRVGTFCQVACSKRERFDGSAGRQAPQQALGSQGHERRLIESGRPLDPELGRDWSEEGGGRRAPLGGHGPDWNLVARRHGVLLAASGRLAVFEDWPVLERHQPHFDTTRPEGVQLMSASGLCVDADQGSNWETKSSCGQR